MNRKFGYPGSHDGYENAPAAAGSASLNLHVEGAERNPSLFGDPVFAESEVIRGFIPPRVLPTPIPSRLDTPSSLFAILDTHQRSG